jgi:transcription termination/antitermination protein NusA
VKSEFMLAITQLSAEKNLPKEVVITAVEQALVSAYKKDNFSPNQNIVVKIDQGTGNVRVWLEKTVVESPEDPRIEITPAEAKKIKTDAQVGDVIRIEATPQNAGRIAAQTAKQVILQRLHEAEHSAIFEEYSNKEGDIVTGVVQRIEPRQVFVDLGRVEAVLPTAEQVRNERYRPGQRVKFYLLEVAKGGKGPQVVISRSHPDLLRRLFELGVPEVVNGIVEVKAIAREAGSRAKIAVVARQEGIDPVGCCVGLRGIRIQNIMKELNGEKLDVVMWSPDPASFIANALSPAQVFGVVLKTDDKVAEVIVPDKQLSLAIGKEGQNARLAAKLTGWHIDIKAASIVEAEKLVKAEAEAALAPPAPEVVPEAEPVTPAPVEEIPVEKPVLVAATAPTPAETVVPVELVPPDAVTRRRRTETTRIRFAEDLLTINPAKVVAVVKKKKKTDTRERTDELKAKKRRQKTDIPDEEEY